MLMVCSLNNYFVYNKNLKEDIKHSTISHVLSLNYINWITVLNSKLECVILLYVLYFVIN